MTFEEWVKEYCIILTGDFEDEAKRLGDLIVKHPEFDKQLMDMDKKKRGALVARLGREVRGD